jgi:NhaP-type Na+/H+ or K+/H+ antiporter
MHKQIHQITEWRQAVFVGFFGPMGVSAIFYLYVAVDYLEKNFVYDGVLREDAQQLTEVLTVVVWFLVICSVVSPLITAAYPR